MSTLAYCIERRKAEMPAFVKVLKAMPPGRLDYTPDPRSRTASALATLIGGEDAALATLIEKGSVEWKDPEPLKSVEEIVALYETSAHRVVELLGKVDDAAWNKKVAFLAGGQVVWEDTLANMCWGFLFDAIHHRGQLSTYLRPMGGKVPAIYGPSADDTGH